MCLHKETQHLNLNQEEDRESGFGALTQKVLYVAFHSVGETREEGIKIRNYYVIHEISWHIHTPTIFLEAIYKTFPVKVLQEYKNSHYSANVRDINYRERETAFRKHPMEREEEECFPAQTLGVTVCRRC